METKSLPYGCAAFFCLIGAATAQEFGTDAPATAAGQELYQAIPLSSEADTEKTDVDVRDARVSQSRLIEEIVVTAQKREENLQDVPISISAFSGESLDARGVTEPSGLGQITPGLNFTSFAGYTFIYIRGVGTDAFIPSADPSVAIYIDGAYIPASQGVVTAFGGIERVEVLKGPQGTLFGRNTTGGAINVVTRKPGSEFAASAQATLGSFNERRAKAYITSPITNSFAASLDVIYGEQDSQYRHRERDIPGDRNKAGRLRLNYHPNDEFDIDLSYFTSVVDGTGSLVSKNTRPAAVLGPILGITSQNDDYVAETDFPGYLRGGNHDLLNATINWSLSPFDVRLIGTDQVVQTDFTAYDFDASPQALVSVEGSGDQYNKSQTLEAQLISNDSSWGHEHFNWVIGTYYLKSRGGYDPVFLGVGPRLLDALLTPAALPDSIQLPDQLTQGLQDLLAVPNSPLGDDGLKIRIEGVVGTKSISAYTQGTWFITDRLDLTLGGRFQREERYLIKANSALMIPGTDEYQQLLPFDLASSKNTNLSPKIAFSFKPRDASLIYLSATRGFKSATYNIVNVYTPPDYVKPEEVTSYELGTKTDFFEGEFRVNAAVFHTDISELQTTFVSLLAGGAVNFQNAGKAKIDGAELDITWLPLPDLDPGLAMTANATYLKSKYIDFENGSGYDEQTGLYRQDLSFTGNSIVRTPKWVSNVALVQTASIGDKGEIEMGIDAYYNSGFFWNSQNSLKEDAYTLINARVSYLYIPLNVRVTAFGKNLTAKKYHASQFETDFGVQSTLAYPLQYGLRFGWEF